MQIRTRVVPTGPAGSTLGTHRCTVTNYGPLGERRERVFYLLKSGEVVEYREQRAHRVGQVDPSPVVLGKRFAKLARQLVRDAYPAAR